MKFNKRVTSALYVVAAGLLILPFQNCGNSMQAANGIDAASSAGATATTPPIAASQLSVKAVSAQEIDLTWSDNSDNESGFIIQRAVAAASGPFVMGTTTLTFQNVHTVGPTPPSYADTNLVAVTSYTYRVVAYNAAGNADATTQMSATTTNAPTTAPAAPSNLSATAYSATQINLAWADNSSNEYGFKVERSTDGTNFTQVALVSADQATYSDINLNPNTLYIYRVRATNSIGDSTYTANASATTMAATNMATFSYLNTNVFVPNCVGCHTTGNADGGVNLNGYANVFSHVSAGNAANSQIYTAVANHVMPPGAPLSATQITAIQTWINNGAQNN